MDLINNEGVVLLLLDLKPEGCVPVCLGQGL